MTKEEQGELAVAISNALVSAMRTIKTHDTPSLDTSKFMEEQKQTNKELSEKMNSLVLDIHEMKIIGKTQKDILEKIDQHITSMDDKYASKRIERVVDRLMLNFVIGILGTAVVGGLIAFYLFKN